MDRPRSDPGASSALGKLAGFVITVVVLAGIYVGYQALQVLFPPNTYETALLATVADTVDADGVLLFDEVYVPGGGTLGYLAADGERVSAGAAVAEIYSSPEQAGLRQQLTSLTPYNEYLTDVIIAVIVYLSAFSLVIKMLFTGRKKRKAAEAAPAEPEPAVTAAETPAVEAAAVPDAPPEDECSGKGGGEA